MLNDKQKSKETKDIKETKETSKETNKDNSTEAVKDQGKLNKNDSCVHSLSKEIKEITNFSEYSYLSKELDKSLNKNKISSYELRSFVNSAMYVLLNLDKFPNTPEFIDSSCEAIRKLSALDLYNQLFIDQGYTSSLLNLIILKSTQQIIRQAAVSKLLNFSN